MHPRSLLASLLLMPTLALAQGQLAHSAAGARLTAATPDIGLQNVSAAQVPARKQTMLGLYVTAAQAHLLKKTQPGQVILLDIRSRAEIAFVGQADGVDAQIPLLEFAYPPTWNAQANRWKMERNPRFIDEVEQAVAQLGADKDAVILLMCRSGDRSARAADLLAEAGFSRVYTVIDGFEGDVGPGGIRNVNGWKNAGAPWGAKTVARLVYGAQ